MVFVAGFCGLVLVWTALFGVSHLLKAVSNIDISGISLLVLPLLAAVFGGFWGQRLRR